MDPCSFGPASWSQSQDQSSRSGSGVLPVPGSRRQESPAPSLVCPAHPMPVLWAPPDRRPSQCRCCNLPCKGLCASRGQDHELLLHTVLGPPCGLRRVNTLNRTAPPDGSQPRERSSKTISCLWALARPTVTTPMGLRPHLVWITRGLVTLPFPVGVQWPRIPLATLDPAGQLWEKIQPVTGLPRGCEAARAVLKDVPTWTKRPLVQLPTHLFLPSL